ncbi:MAG: hypothetical protein JWL62_2947 [Hyphomicrobiales bacterium]|nr:hypothetical protein [Hyphomicrobiales bacterium]
MRARSILKAIFPKTIRALIVRARAALELRRFERQWARARRRVTERTLSALARVLIVPSDPLTLVGALGDDAMIGATIEALGANIGIEIVTQGDAASRLACARGLVPVDIWANDDFPSALAALLNERLYDAVVLVGADIMDGYYSPMVSAKMIAAADLAAQAGARATVLGFSFNVAPAAGLARMFNRADPRVQWKLRD